MQRQGQHSPIKLEPAAHVLIVIYPPFQDATCWALSMIGVRPPFLNEVSSVVAKIRVTTFKSTSLFYISKIKDTSNVFHATSSSKTGFLTPSISTTLGKFINSNFLF